MERHAMFPAWKTKYKNVSSPPNWSIDLMQYLSKSQQDFCSFRQAYFMFIWNGKRTSIAKLINKLRTNKEILRDVNKI